MWACSLPRARLGHGQRQPYYRAHTRAKPRALPARPRPCHPAHTRPIVISNDPPNAGAAAKIFFCSRAPFARPVVRRGPAHPTPTPAPPPRAPRPNPVAGASFPTSRLRAQRRGSIGRRSKPPRLRDRAEHRDDFCLLGAHPAEHGARSGRSQSPRTCGHAHWTENAPSWRPSRGARRSFGPLPVPRTCGHAHWTENAAVVGVGGRSVAWAVVRAKEGGAGSSGRSTGP